MVRNSAVAAIALYLSATCFAADIRWETDYAAALERAMAEKKPLLIDFYAEWCGPCKAMEAQTFNDPAVQKAVDGFVPVQVDIDRNSRVAFAYKIQSIPRTIVLNVFGEKVGDRVGFLGATEYVSFLKEVDEFTQTKIDGVIVEIPSDDPGGADIVAVNDSTEWAELVTLMTSPEPAGRNAARQELLTRDSAEVRAFVEAGLRDDYLGVRIAAWETLRDLTATDPAYDPWAPKAERDAAAAKIELDNK